MNRADKLTGNQIVQLYIQAFEIRMENKDAASEQTNDDYSPSDYTGRPDSVSGKAKQEWYGDLVTSIEKQRTPCRRLMRERCNGLWLLEFYRHRYEGGREG